MAKAIQVNRTKTVKGKGTNNNVSDTVSCNMCKGTGRLKAGYNKKKK